MRYLVLLILISLISLSSIYADTSVDILHYQFSVKLRTEDDTVRVNAQLKIRKKNPDDTILKLDFHALEPSSGLGMKIDRLLVNGVSSDFLHQSEQLSIEWNHIKVTDTVTIQIEYKGIPKDGLYISENKFGERTFFADHWPDRAHYWLPVIDDLADKATCEFIVSVPYPYQAIANGYKVSESINGGGEYRVHWKEDHPIPVKVMVIGVAQFRIQALDSTGFSKAWIYPETGTKGFEDFAEAPEIYNLFEEKLGHYAFDKLDHVQSTTKYSGMENASNIFYDEKKIIGSGQLGTLIAHEIAHQWFGNSATEASWNHIWLSEGFAEFFENYYIEKRHGEEAVKAKYEQDRQKISAYEQQFPFETVLIKKVENPSTILSPLAYEKGAWILKMIRYQVGEELFWSIMKSYHTRYRHANASTTDFIQIVEEKTREDWGAFFYQWLEKPGGVDISYSIKEKEGKTILNIIQKTPHTYDLMIHWKESKQDKNSGKIHVYKKRQKIILENANRMDILLDPDQIIYGNIQKAN